MAIVNNKLKSFIEGENWSAYGVISASDLEEALKRHESAFKKWDESGNSAGMDYLRNMMEDRFHPENKLPDVKSVIVLGATYFGGGPMVDRLWTPPSAHHRPTSGIVARYAHGRDYHKVLKKRLAKLADFLETLNPKLEIRSYASVDSGPTVDRVLAEAAGLGFFGKNSMIIDPSRGSYFFIASLMTNLELEPTEKRQMPSCGDCTKCSVACPTGAITAPGVIDARRCISYLTIENKEGIPIELRPKIGNRLFGCDICQEVCPFNIGRAHKQEVLIEDLKGNLGELDLRDVLSIETDEQFLQQFAGTPLMRAKRRGLIRNACVVAGNSGDTSLIPYLEAVRDRESDEMLKEHAEWGIENMKT